MLGLIKKELYMLLNNKKSLILIIFLFIMFSSKELDSISFIIPYMVLAMSISSFTYDDFNNWHAYGISLPKGKESIVKAKYLSGLILLVLTSILTTIITYILTFNNQDFNLQTLLISSLESICALLFIISLLYPLLFKFGAEKGRIYIFILVFAFSGILTLIPNIILNQLPSIESFINIYGYYLIPIIIILLLYGSYKLSLKIYNKREF